MPLRLFDSSTREEASAALARGPDTRPHPSIIRTNETALLFAEQAEGRLVSRDRFVWDGVCSALVHPEPVPIALFARAPDGRYTWLADRPHLASYGAGGTTFILRAPVPRVVARDFGCPAPPPDPLLGPALVHALEAPRSDRFAIVRRFHEGWFGALGAAPPATGPAPIAVREWHALWRALCAAHRNAAACQPVVWVEANGVWIFQNEEQGVCQWGIASHDCGEDDPPVVMRVDGEWSPVSRCVSEFALQFLLTFAATTGGTGVNGWMDVTQDQVHASLDRGLTNLPLPDWIWPGAPTRLFYTARSYACLTQLHGNVQLALIAPDDESYFATLDQLELPRDALETTYSS